MNKLACASHRTGHPRCEQLTANATNPPDFRRRSHAAVIAVTPAQATGDGSRNLTLTVSPGLKLSTAPTARHTSGSGASSGPRMNPTTGIPTITAATVESAIQSRPMKRRRSGLSASPRFGCCVSLAMQQFSHPLANRDGHQNQTGGGKYIGTEYSEKQERYAEREERRRIGRRRVFLRERRAPPGCLVSACLRSFFRGHPNRP